MGYAESLLLAVAGYKLPGKVPLIVCFKVPLLGLLSFGATPSPHASIAIAIIQRGVLALIHWAFL